mmetsp:Transcript_70072/g.169629  ORF Transcript_70072/g.169629 Transcript_70072/m.169629 type:complete len:274 (+) Transcript_70072:306-1127(+)
MHRASWSMRCSRSVKLALSRSTCTSKRPSARPSCAASSVHREAEACLSFWPSSCRHSVASEPRERESSRSSPARSTRWAASASRSSPARSTRWASSASPRRSVSARSSPSRRAWAAQASWPTAWRDTATSMSSLLASRWFSATAAAVDKASAVAASCAETLSSSSCCSSPPSLARRRRSSLICRLTSSRSPSSSPLALAAAMLRHWLWTAASSLPRTAPSLRNASRSSSSSSGRSVSASSPASRPSASPLRRRTASSVRWSLDNSVALQADCS